jgi:hypothetical protein
MVEADVDIIVAIIALISSVLTAMMTIILTRQNDVKLRRLENELETKRDELNARRDYEYEAKKRLYQDCEPILFQFAEFSESAIRRIHALAKNAREGNLGPERFYLSSDHYFFRSTIYRLLVPLATFKILQNRLTGIDLQLDPLIDTQYQLGKILYYTFSSAEDLAKSTPQIAYDPDQIEDNVKNLSNEQKIENRKKNPEKYWLQGLKVGTLDKLVELLIVNNNINERNIQRIISFGEFEEKFFVLNKGSDANKFEIFFTLFTFFHPKSRPVLWRILLSQAFLYSAIHEVRKGKGFLYIKEKNYEKLFHINENKNKCEWKQVGETISEEEFQISFMGAENYLVEILNTIST